MDEETWVSLKVAHLLKKLGFNEECYGKYEKLEDGVYRFWETFQPITYDDIWDDTLIAPQVWLVVEWLLQQGVELEDNYTMEDIEEVLKKLLE